jgi:hypothetical protein
MPGLRVTIDAAMRARDVSRPHPEHDAAAAQHGGATSAVPGSEAAPPTQVTRRPVPRDPVPRDPVPRDPVPRDPAPATSAKPGGRDAQLRVPPPRVPPQPTAPGKAAPGVTRSRDSAADGAANPQQLEREQAQQVPTGSSAQSGGDRSRRRRRRKR